MNMMDEYDEYDEYDDGYRIKCRYRGVVCVCVCIWVSICKYIIG